MLDDLSLYSMYYVLQTECHLSNKSVCENCGPNEREEILDQLKIKEYPLISMLRSMQERNDG